MGYEKSPFGNADATNVKSNVSNHYGPRATGGERGVVKTEGMENEATVDFNGTGPLYINHVIPAGSVVTQIVELGLTGSVSAATVGATDISGANGTEASYVVIATAGSLTVTGPTAGTVVVKYRKLRQDA